LERPRLSPREAFVESLKMTREAAAGTGGALSDAVSSRADLGGVMGPIGIAWFSGRMADRFGFPALLWVAGILSLAVAFFNLIPMPPLDGGQAAILALEAIAGRDLGARARLGLSLVGIAFLLGLVVVTTHADVSRLLR
jgi:regulator of sigma E protease